MTSAAELVTRAADRWENIGFDSSRTFLRLAATVAFNRGNNQNALHFVKASNWADKDTIARWLEKAAVGAGTTTTWGAPLASAPGAREFLDLVQPTTILGRLAGRRRVPFQVGAVLQTLGGVFTWIAENAPTPVGAFAFDDASLPPAKAGGIVALSRELLTFAAPGSEDVFRRQLANGLRAFSDVAFIDPTLAAVPGESPGSITNGITDIPSTGNPAEDLRALLGSFETIEDVAVIVSPLAAIAIATAIPGAIQNGSLLFGFLPLVISSATGDNMVAVHQPSILYADDGGIEIEASDQATLQMDSDPTDPGTSGTVLVSLWQTNTSALKVTRWMNWARANDEAVAVISAATYPAA